MTANDNNEYPDKQEFLRLGAIVWPTKTHYRWDKMWRSLDNFLWFLRFETSYAEREALAKRKEITVVK